ncbi:MAG: ribosome recycling factor [Pseudomonadota bacterium]|nr:ribosome recycling factor [Pseudomonadota bacterium]
MAQLTTFDLKDVDRRMHGAVEVLKHEFAGLRTGRASAGLLDPIVVDAYGAMMPLNQVASVTVPEPRLISVQVWDRGVVIAVEKAIQASNLGLNPQTEGQVIRLRIPELSQERRKELTKVAHQYAEKARIAVRNVRRDGMETLKKLEKDHKISEDEHRGKGEEVQELTDRSIRDIDAALAHKESEIMQV